MYTHRGRSSDRALCAGEEFSASVHGASCCGDSLTAVLATASYKSYFKGKKADVNL